MSDTPAPDYVVVGHPRSRAMRLILMLEELGQPYAVDPAAPHSEAARAANPEGKIPALRVGGDCLTDSVAMMQFLADRHGALTFPAGTLERARQDAHLMFVLDEIEGALWTGAKHLRMLPEDRRVPAAAETARWEFDLALAKLAARLGEGPWLMGATCTVPDILIGHCFTWAQGMGWQIPPALADYAERLKARPARAAALARAKTVIDAAA